MSTVIDLGDNTSRFGTPPAALSVFGAARPDDATAYPAPAAGALRAALAEAAGVAPARVVTGCGSDDVIDCAIRAFAREGERLVFPAPTFSMIPEFARNQRMHAVPVPFLANGEFDVEALLAAQPGVLYLCVPNNPTGHLPGGDLERLIDGVDGLVILDQAYAEFAGRTPVAAAPGHPRLLVTRTLSKAYGLAGLRIGYGIGSEPLIERIARIRGPYRIGRLAERAAVEVLRGDQDWVRDHVARSTAARRALAAALEAAGFRPLPSEANFVLVPVQDAAAVAARMLASGVRVRAFADLAGIGDAVRITAGPDAEMDAALRALTLGATRHDAAHRQGSGVTTWFAAASPAPDRAADGRGGPPAARVARAASSRATPEGM